MRDTVTPLTAGVRLRPRPDPSLEHEQDPRQRLPGRDRSLKRLDQLPELVRDDPGRSGQLEDGCREPSPSENGVPSFRNQF